MVSNKELESVVEQVNAAYSRMEKRIAALEEALAAAKPAKKESSKKDLTFDLLCGIVRRYITYAV